MAGMTVKEHQAVLRRLNRERLEMERASAPESGYPGWMKLHAVMRLGCIRRLIAWRKEDIAAARALEAKRRKRKESK